MPINFYQHAFEPPGPVFAESNQTKFNWNRISTDIVDLKDYPAGHEVLGVEVDITDRIYDGEKITCHSRFYNNNTGALLFSFDYPVPDPGAGGWSYWARYQVKSWMGRTANEVDGPMTIKVVVGVKKAGKLVSETDKYFTVVDTTAWPAFPSDKLSAHVKPIWDKMKLAYETNNKNLMLEALREAAGTSGTPVALIAVFAVLGVLELIVGLLGTYVLSNFLDEEALQILDLNIDRALSAKDIAGAEKLIQSKRETVEKLTGRDKSENQAHLRDMLTAIRLICPLATPPFSIVGFGLKEMLGYLATIPILKDLPVLTVIAAVDQYIEKADLAISTQEERLRLLKEEIEAQVPVTISSTPTGAKIYIDDVYTYNTTNTTIIVEAGPHTLTLKKEGYYDLIKSFDAPSGGAVAISETLSQIPAAKGRLILSISPSDSTVNVAGQPQITGPGTYSLDPGTYTILVTKEGYYDKSQTAIINSNQDTTVAVSLTEKPVVPPPEPEQATLIIQSSPAGAKIYIDGIYKYTTTPYTIKLDPGSYIIRLELSGYDISEESITLNEGETKSYTKVLTEIIVTPPPVTPPPVTPPEQPTEEVIIPLVPAVTEYNAWKVTIRGVDATTNEELHAAILINDEYMNKYTPFYFYFEPEASYNIKLRLKGYYQGEVTFTTKPLP